ncbi:MAG: BatA domain-containing protein [Planctomycetota bacterium]
MLLGLSFPRLLGLAHPGLLWAGLGLISVPILIHIFFRRQHRIIRWAAMDFLMRALQKQKRRMQTENLILLIVRCLLLALLGLALARPAVHAGAVAQLTAGSRNVVLIIDTSASMSALHTGRRALDRARERAASLLDGLPDSSRVTLIATRDDLAGGAPRAPIQNAKPTEARARLAGLKPSHGPNHLGDVFRMARDKLLELPGNRVVAYLTDLQRRDWFESDGARREDVYRALRSLRPDDETGNVPVTVIDIGSEKIANVAISEFEKEHGLELFAGTLSGLVVTLTNYGPTDASGVVTLSMAREGEDRWEKKTAVDVDIKRSIEVGSASKTSRKLHLPLPPGSEGLARFKVTFRASSGAHDRLAADSERLLALRVRPPVRFLPISTDPTRTLSMFRDAEYEGGPIDLIAPAMPGSLSTADLSAVDVVVWADAETINLDESAVANLERFVRGGGGFLAYLGQFADPAHVNRLLFKERGEGLLPMRLRDGPEIELDDESPVRFDLTEKIDHPLFREMTRDSASRAIFYSPEVFRFRAVDECPPEAVLARFTSPGADPAVIEHTLGRGHVVAIMTTPDERGYRLNGSLVPMVLFFEAAHYLVAEDTANRNVAVGQPILIPLPPGTREAFIEPPEGAGGNVTEPIDAKREILVVAETTMPGFYRVGLRGASAGPTGGLVTTDVHLAAVNMEADEGDLRRLPTEQLRRAYPGIPFQFGAEDGSLAASGGPGEGELSRALLGGVGILLFVELLLAWRFGRRRRAAQ